MKKLIAILPILLLLTLTGTVVVHAADDLGAGNTIKTVTKIEARATAAAARMDANLQRIQTRASTMIDNRIGSLNNLLNRITNDTRLSSDEKASFATDVQNTITQLTNLKAKIMGDTDAQTAKTDTQTIVTSYHIYLIFEPKERLTVMIDNLLTVTTNVQNLMPQIQSLLTTLSSQGKDISSLQPIVTDINSKLSDATTKLNADKTTLGGISLTADPATVKTTFTQIKQDLVAVRQDFATIRADFAKLKTGIKALGGTPTGAPTPTPTP